MARINYNFATLYQTSLEVMVYYHARILKLGYSEQEKTPHSEVVNACIDGPLDGALYEIGEWSRKWSRVVSPDMDSTELPEIALSLNITSKGNLEVLWAPIITKEQYDASPYKFRRWLEQLGERPFGEQRPKILYFIREYRDLIWRVKSDQQKLTFKEDVELCQIAALILALMMKELPSKLSYMVNAYWQDVIDFDFSKATYGNTPIPGDIKIHKMWDYSKREAHETLSRNLKNIGSNADDFSAKWNQVSISNPKINTDSGRAKIVAKELGVTVRQIEETKSAMAEAEKWNEEKPHLWWSRKDPYSNF